jgi:protein-disulfide isomerase
MMRFYVIIAAMACGLAAQNWKTARELPGVDMTGLNPDQRAAALTILREESCNCGCSMKIAQCRFEDPQCGYSRALATAVVKNLKAGKSMDQARAIVVEMAKEAPAARQVLEDPVPIATKGDPSRGPATARVTIVEFSDFQCPYCAMAAPKVLALAAQYPRDVRVVFKQFPLDMHSQARLAAEASLAAAAQGKFWELHDRMFANFRSLSRENILKWASESDVEMSRFQQDLASGKYRPVVEHEVQEGIQAGVMGTPTFYLNGKRYNGAMEPDVVKPLIEAELKSVTRPAAARAR